MTDVNLTIKDEDEHIRVINAFKAKEKIPMVAKDAKDHSKGVEPMFSDEEWVKECLKRYVAKIVYYYEQKEATLKPNVKNIFKEG